MIFLKVFYNFFIIGLCAFGGGLATIPFLEELSFNTGWFTLDELANMIAISESTPGAIGVNMSTYAGYLAIFAEYHDISIALLGGICGTLGLICPSIIVILIISKLLEHFKDNKYVNYAFYGLRAASIGLIASAAFSILKISIIDLDSFNSSLSGFNNIASINDFFNVLANSLNSLIDYKCLALALFLGIIIKKFKLHPIIYIAIAAIIGIIFQF